MTSLRRRPALRWLAPIATAIVFVGAGSLISAFTNAAQADLAPRSAAQLLVDVQNARLDGLSGTIAQSADLGIPSLPGIGGGSSDLSSLVSGSHTLRLWYDGPDHVRLALLGQFGESDVVRNGADLWTWSSTGHSATHSALPSNSAGHDSSPLQGEATMTPQAAADAALKAISPSTSVTTNGTDIVAGRAAYLLTLQPKSSNSLVGSVQIAIDGKTHVPTRVQVFAVGASKPSLSVGFTSFNPGAPSSSVFGFNPPPGTKVTQEKGEPRSLTGKKTGRSAVDNADPKVVGSGWTSVLVASAPDVVSGSGSTATLLQKLPEVSGTWGSGRLLEGTLFSVLLTQDGRIVVGAVPPSVLYAALAAG
ncbi:MAG: Outer rane lipoproteinsorting protein [Marmoricola sp.]|jgi:outer membrane lipoprotein-sorting protein|nr:Outer rane lipoproteinsorting protein [Marmoricola sp.]